MKITRKNVLHRLYQQQESPLVVKLDDYAYSISYWSKDGFRLSEWDRFEEDFNVSDTFSCYIRLPFGGFDIAFDAEVKLDWFESFNKTASFKFINLSKMQCDVLSQFNQQFFNNKVNPILGVVQ